MSDVGIDIDALEKDLVTWVREWSEDESGAEIGPETDLGGAGLLDSMGVVALISYLEEQTGAAFDFGTFDPDDGASIRNLVRHCLA